MATALSARLGSVTELAIDVTRGPSLVAPPAVIIATTTDCRPALCATLVARGLAVVILASVPRQVEQETYRSAGASAYLAISLDLDLLGQTVVRLAKEHAERP